MLALNGEDAPSRQLIVTVIVSLAFFGAPEDPRLVASNRSSSFNPLYIIWGALALQPGERSRRLSA